MDYCDWCGCELAYPGLQNRVDLVGDDYVIICDACATTAKEGE